MVFDKTKAMRNAERFLAQGKIQSAIGEYKQVVANDPKDIGTLNMLGDLYTKNSEKKQAVGCYTTVAEHYSKQGFAQKAIAVYNKISKIQPNSVEISAKLADLYKFKGSLNEARAHYAIVAEHYERGGQKIEALEVRKQIASLDPNDTAIFVELAKSYLAEAQIEDAADAFTEAGVRFAKKSEHKRAIDIFEQALEHRPRDQKTLAAFVQSHFSLGSAAAAAERLATIHEEDTNDRDVLQLLIDCHMEAGNTAEAEKFVIKLVEKEPTNYPKFVELARLYLKNNDAESAARVTSISSEHLLLAGQVDEFQSLVADILDLEPEQLEGLRLRARLTVWQRDETNMCDALAKLAVVAQERESVDDERFALSQLVMLVPQEIRYAERLREINEEYGFEDAYANGNGFDQQFMRSPQMGGPEAVADTFAIVSPVIESNNGLSIEDSDASFELIDDAHDSEADETDVTIMETLDETDDERLAREVDSIRFYIDSEYFELADKAIAELRAEFGGKPEIDEIAAYLANAQSGETAEEASEEIPVVEAPVVAEDVAPVYDDALAKGSAYANGQPSVSQGFGIDDLRSELGIDDVESLDDSDYDTHYHTAVAYQEMGLLDEAIKEFQEAVGLVQPSDKARRFFHCANLLGHCFMQKGMPNLALKWFQRALETPDLSDDEKQGIWYELASAYEADGDTTNAGRYFEQVYAENIDFRDVSERVRNLAVGR